MPITRIASSPWALSPQHTSVPPEDGRVAVKLERPFRDGTVSVEILPFSKGGKPFRTPPAVVSEVFL